MISSRPIAVSISFFEPSRDVQKQKCKVSCMPIVHDLRARLFSYHHNVGSETAPKAAYLVEFCPTDDPSPYSHTQTIPQEDDVFHDHD